MIGKVHINHFLFSLFQISEMMDCVNNVCLAKNGYEMVIGLIKLGRVCKNYPTPKSFDFEENNTP